MKLDAGDVKWFYLAMWPAVLGVLYTVPGIFSAQYTLFDVFERGVGGLLYVFPAYVLFSIVFMMMTMPVVDMLADILWRVSNVLHAYLRGPNAPARFNLFVTTTSVVVLMNGVYAVLWWCFNPLPTITGFSVVVNQCFVIGISFVVVLVTTEDEVGDACNNLFISVLLLMSSTMYYIMICTDTPVPIPTESIRHFVNALLLHGSMSFILAFVYVIHVLNKNNSTKPRKPTA